MDASASAICQALLVRQCDLTRENHWLHEVGVRRRQSLHECQLEHQSQQSDLRRRCAELTFVNEELTKRNRRMGQEMNEMKRIVSDVYESRGIWRCVGDRHRHSMVMEGSSMLRRSVPILPESKSRRPKVSSIRSSSARELTTQMDADTVMSLLDVTQSQKKLFDEQNEYLKKEVEILRKKLKIERQENARLRQEDVTRARIRAEEGIGDDDVMEFAVTRLRRRVRFLEQELENSKATIHRLLDPRRGDDGRGRSFVMRSKISRGAGIGTRKTGTGKRRRRDRRRRRRNRTML